MTPEQLDKQFGKLNDRIRCLSCQLSSTTSDLFVATIDFSVNADPNTVGTTFSPNTPQLSTVIYVSTIDASLWTWNGSAYVIYVPPFWSKLGNSGTTPGTNFIGTTDNKALQFKVNNVIAGTLSVGNNVSFGYQAHQYLVSGGNNVAFGTNAGKILNNANNNTFLGHGSAYYKGSGDDNVAIGYFTLAGAASGVGNTGIQNTGIGNAALTKNTTGRNNTATSYYSLYNNTTGGYNVGLGSHAGYNNTTVSNQIFINSLYRASYAADQTESPIYIQQNATVANQNIYLNGLMNLSYVPTYTNNAAALLGGLIAGNLYKINNSGTYTLAIVV